MSLEEDFDKKIEKHFNKFLEIKEVKEVCCASDVNDLLKEGWKLLQICNDGNLKIVYVMGG